MDGISLSPFLRKSLLQLSIKIPHPEGPGSLQPPPSSDRSPSLVHFSPIQSPSPSATPPDPTMSSTPAGAPSADAREHQHHDAPPAAAAAATDAADPAATAERELTDEEVAERHRAWMAEHGRVYGDEAERERRLGIFRDNLRFIQAHNRGGHSYTLGLNLFADLSNEEFRATYCGALPQSDWEAPPIGDDPNGTEREEEEPRGKGGPVLGSPPPPPPASARTG